MSNVIICDDSRVACQLLRKPLMREGHNVVAEVHTAEDALMRVRDLKPDLITMDLVMPKKNGTDAYKAIQLIHKEFPKIKIVIVSAMNQEGIREKIFQMGCSGFVVKPFKEVQVAKALRKVIAPSEAPLETAKEGGPFLLTEIGKDALTEICNVAVGNASGNLSDYLGVPVDLSVPEVYIQRADKSLKVIHVEKGPHLFFLQQLRGLRISGYLTYTISKASAKGILAFVREASVDTWGKREKTDFQKLSTVLSNTFLDAFNKDLQAHFTNLTMEMMEGELDEVIQKITNAAKIAEEEEEEEEEYIVAIMVEMTVREKKWYSYFILALNEQATETLLEAVMEKLEKINS